MRALTKNFSQKARTSGPKTISSLYMKGNILSQVTMRIWTFVVTNFKRQKFGNYLKSHKITKKSNHICGFNRPHTRNFFVTA